MKAPNIKRKVKVRKTLERLDEDEEDDKERIGVSLFSALPLFTFFMLFDLLFFFLLHIRPDPLVSSPIFFSTIDSLGFLIWGNLKKKKTGIPSWLLSQMYLWQN